MKENNSPEHKIPFTQELLKQAARAKLMEDKRKSKMEEAKEINVYLPDVEGPVKTKVSKLNHSYSVPLMSI